MKDLISDKIRFKNMSVDDRVKYVNEDKYEWLPILLDCYAKCDKGEKLLVEREERRRGKKVACHKGCYACCLKSAIPVIQIESTGISWYVSEVLDITYQRRLFMRLKKSLELVECPFLMDEMCSIYPVRPLACRDFFVYGEACSVGENVIETRSQDVHLPNSDLGKAVAMRLFDCEIFGLTSQSMKAQAFRDGLIVKMSRHLHELDLSQMGDTVKLFAKERFDLDISI
jgi:Fe-S-cluster containining protein